MMELEAAVSAVLEAGETLAASFGKAEAVHYKSDHGKDAVTQLDIDTELLIKQRLEAHDPSIGFAGEEMGGRGIGTRYWLLDPIDGTAHFIRGIPFCTTMLALIDDGEVVLSVINNFVTKELFTAEKGKGAACNDKPIRVSERTLRGAYLSVETDLTKEKNLSAYMRIRSRAGTLHTINCGYEFGLVASGKIEGRIGLEPFGYDWDYAPGSLLVSEAGGIVANIGMRSFDFKNHDFLAVNPTVYRELTEGDDAIFPLA